MTAPITPDIREWAAAYVASLAEVAAITGRPVDLAHAERSIREALLSGPRWQASAADEVEGDYPGWARAGSDRIADRWTGDRP
jgi:hypothetical protein